MDKSHAIAARALARDHRGTLAPLRGRGVDLVASLGAEVKALAAQLTTDH